MGRRRLMGALKMKKAFFIEEHSGEEEDVGKKVQKSKKYDSEKKKERKKNERKRNCEEACKKHTVSVPTCGYVEFSFAGYFYNHDTADTFM